MVVFSFFRLTNQLVNCQLKLTVGLSLDALFNSPSYVLVTEGLTTVTFYAQLLLDYGDHVVT